jgi:hypothetical protein
LIAIKTFLIFTLSLIFILEWFWILNIICFLRFNFWLVFTKIFKLPYTFLAYLTFKTSVCSLRLNRCKSILNLIEFLRNLKYHLIFFILIKIIFAYILQASIIFTIVKNCIVCSWYFVHIINIFFFEIIFEKFVKILITFMTLLTLIAFCCARHIQQHTIIIILF